MFEMIWLSKSRKRRQLFRGLLVLVCLLAPTLCILVFLTPDLPEVKLDQKIRPDETKLGKLVLLMIEMLPDNLAFTLFAPSEEAFDHVLKLRSNNTLTNDTMAILSRTMAFCTVPLRLLSAKVPLSEELTLDSVSGFRIYVSKNSDGTLSANNVGSKEVDIRKGEVVVHLMNGVIMDAEFEQSFMPDFE